MVCPFQLDLILAPSYFLFSLTRRKKEKICKKFRKKNRPTIYIFVYLELIFSRRKYRVVSIDFDIFNCYSRIEACFVSYTRKFTLINVQIRLYKQCRKRTKNETSRQSDEIILNKKSDSIDNLVQNNLVVEPELDSCLAIDLMYANYHGAKYYWDQISKMQITIILCWRVNRSLGI